jgi:hypothetical protein
MRSQFDEVLLALLDRCRFLPSRALKVHPKP